MTFSKVLEGREWLSTDGFYISLNGVLAETGEQVWSQSMYVQDGEEKTFMPTIDAPGTYTFTLWEAVGEIPGITYATNNYVFTVEVTDNLDGTMTATIVDELAFPLSFTNTYVEPVKPEVPKTGDARTLPFAGLGLLLAAAGVAFLRRRREEF